LCRNVHVAHKRFRRHFYWIWGELTPFFFTANAPDHQIDERERIERNAAYFHAYQGVIAAVFLLLLASILAWRSTAEEEDRQL